MNGRRLWFHNRGLSQALKVLPCCLIQTIVMSIAVNFWRLYDVLTASQDRKGGDRWVG